MPEALVRHLGPGDDWGPLDAWLASHPQALVYPTEPYRRMLAAVVGAPGEALVAWGPEGPLAALVFVRAQGPKGEVLNGLPFYGGHGGPWWSPGPEGEAALGPLGAAWQALCRRPGVAVGVLVENPLAPLPEGLAWGEAWDQRVGQLTPLPAGPEAEAALWASFHHKTRNMVRKAEALGIRVRVSDSAEDWAFLEATHVANLQALGGLAKPPRFFAALQSAFPPADRPLLVAELDGTPVAALLLLLGGVCAEYFVPVIPRAHRDSQGLSLLVWHGMRLAQARGMAHWNWGGTWASQDGVYRFKSKWGTQDFGYRYWVSLTDEGLLASQPAELLAQYPNFYTVPFSKLAPQTSSLG